MKKLKLYISMSLDGFLATKDDDLSWLSIVNKEGEDYGYEAFNNTVDTYIVGKRTYDKVLELTNGIFPAAEKHDCYIITRTEKAPLKNITFYSGDLNELISSLKSKGGKDIYCDGGGQVVKMLLEKDLIDELIISVIPIVLGDGKRLFKGGIDSSLELKLEGTKTFDTGLVQLHYKRKDR